MVRALGPGVGAVFSARAAVAPSDGVTWCSTMSGGGVMIADDMGRASDPCCFRRFLPGAPPVSSCVSKRASAGTSHKAMDPSHPALTIVARSADAFVAATATSIDDTGDV